MAKLPVVHDRHAVVRCSMGQAVTKQIMVQLIERAKPIIGLILFSKVCKEKDFPPLITQFFTIHFIPVCTMHFVMNYLICA